MPTIKDVAKLAGVGLATASRVINNSGYVSKETKRKVEDAIKTLGYVPNETARAFVTQDNKIVALFLPSINHAFFSELTYYIEDELDKEGYKLMLCNSSNQLEKELEYINMLRQNRVSGIIGISYNDIEDYVDSNMPIVFLDRHIKDIPFVASDNYAGGVLSAEKLYENGCVTVAYIGTHARRILTEVEKRRIGFFNTAKKLGLTYIEHIEIDPIEDQTTFLKSFIENNPKIDGVFVENDMMGLELAQLANENNINIPEDLKIIGFDGIKTFGFSRFKLSTIRQPVEKIGKSLVKTIVKKINGENTSAVVLPVEFVKGNTTQ